MSDTHSRSDEQNHDSLMVSRGTARPGKTLRLLLGAYAADNLRNLTLRIDNVEYEVYVHRDRDGDKTLWVNVYNRKKDKLDVELRAMGGSDANTPAA